MSTMRLRVRYKQYYKKIQHLTREFRIMVAEHSFARAFADAIQHAYKDWKNKRAINRAIILGPVHTYPDIF